jgi:hypothetical protein
MLEPAIPGAKKIDVSIKASTLIAKGTILGEITASPGVYAPYAHGNVDGSQVPKVIAVYDMQTDASGNITYTTTAGQAGGEFGQTELQTPVYYSGVFNNADLVGLSANMIADQPAWHYIMGAYSSASGLLEI